MFLLSKTLGVMILPPGLLLLLLLLCLTFLFLGRRKTATALLALTTLSFYALSTEPVKDMILLPLENSYPYPKHFDCDAIVVLGGGKVPHSPSERNRSAVMPATAVRLFEAFKVWKKVHKPIVVTGGSVYGRGEPEAVVMKRFLLSIGVPSSQVLKESRSRNTAENTLFTARILKSIGAKKVCLVTSAFHMRRSVAMFRTAGICVLPVPTDYRTSRAPYGWFSFLPRAGNFGKSTAGIKELIGMIYFELIQKRKILRWRAREDSNLRPTD